MLFRSLTVFTTLKDKLKIPGLVRDPHLVRGLDYYTRTAFEVVHNGLGAQNALGGGGRYDDLVQRMGGVAVPAIGFAVGLERILMILQEKTATSLITSGPKAFVASVAAAQIPAVLALAESLREQGVPVTANLEDRPLKRQMEQAAKAMPQGKVLILGEEEIQKDFVTVKDLSTGHQRQVARKDVISEIS